MCEGSLGSNRSLWGLRGLWTAAELPGLRRELDKQPVWLPGFVWSAKVEQPSLPVLLEQPEPAGLVGLVCMDLQAAARETHVLACFAAREQAVAQAGLEQQVWATGWEHLELRLARHLRSEEQWMPGPAVQQGQPKRSSDVPKETFLQNPTFTQAHVGTSRIRSVTRCRRWGGNLI